jgi:hypothetical protein
MAAKIALVSDHKSLLLRFGAGIFLLREFLAGS